MFEGVRRTGEPFEPFTAVQFRVDLERPNLKLAHSRSARSAAKRGFDLLVSAGALLFLLPALIFIGLLVRWDSPGPSLFKQQRTGLNGRVFWIFKFRTMRCMENDASVAQARKGDDRVTRLGAILRKYSIDEIPQLLNVLNGTMSIVGPRPHAVSHDEYYGAQLPAYSARFRAKPGLTGLAQVEGYRGEIHTSECMERRIDADNRYIEQWSFASDLVIVARTVPLVVHDPRAY